MQRGEFLAQQEVAAFIDWLIESLPTLKVELSLKSSKFVPGGLHVRTEGFEQLLQHYRWGVDWQETREILRQLRTRLHDSVEQGNNTQAFQASCDVLRWGGLRSPIPFLKGLEKRGELAAHLQDMVNLLNSGNDARLSKLNAASIVRFDSGLATIYALLDRRGSPIYDSRVGAAIAMLYGRFCLQQGLPGRPTLNFPSGPARGQQIRNPGAFEGHKAAPQFYSWQVPHHEWARSQLRLGWIIHAVLERTNWFAQEGEQAECCHAFEACLFMLGYDLRCFGLAIAEAGAKAPSRQDSSKDDDLAIAGGKKWVPAGHPFPQTLRDYWEHRKAGGDPTPQAFQQWLQTQRDRPVKLSTARAYCFPFSDREFSLWERPLDELAVIVGGGEQALYAVIGSKESLVQGDELESVCLVDAWLAGQVYGLANENALQALVMSGFAGTHKAAATLLSVGCGVGQHFGLLDQNKRPTALYARFFADSMMDLAEQLNGAL
ncbi:hypothetical protein [Pseudomonas sp.]|uniref:hypothetical protein n=1 Tax=Pseudomonas sp. TaxID=306 RepID=UPI001A05E79B|nr:hypothetical protein [Pseudomonas sp.]MBF0675266.1 hypothetical protein [Pseudomonas sp.]